MISLNSPHHLVKGPTIPANLPDRVYAACDGCPVISLYLDANCSGWCNTSYQRSSAPKPATQTPVAWGEKPSPKSPSDSVARATLSLSPHPFTSDLNVRSLRSYRETARSANPLLIRIARVEPRGVWGRRWPHRRREGARRSEPPQLWMNFWFEQTERRSAECADNNRHNGEEPQRFSASDSLQPLRFLIFTGRDGFLCAGDWPAKAVFFPSKTPTRWTLIKVSALSPPSLSPLTHRRYQTPLVFG